MSAGAISFMALIKYRMIRFCCLVVDIVVHHSSLEPLKVCLNSFPCLIAVEDEILKKNSTIIQFNLV